MTMITFLKTMFKLFYSMSVILISLLEVGVCRTYHCSMTMYGCTKLTVKHNTPYAGLTCIFKQFVCCYSERYKYTQCKQK